MKKLDKKNIEDVIAPTPAQEGMLLHYSKEPDSGAYFEQLTLDIPGEIDVKTFENAWNFVIETNGMLRTAFRREKGENPLLVVLKEHKIQAKYYDFSGAGIKEAQKRLEEAKIKDRADRFDLREVPFRVTLCKVGKDKHEMMISNHHILYDGWSNRIILKEFFEAYHTLYKEKGLKKSPAKRPFKEFIKWLREHDRHAQKEYWTGYLAGFDGPAALPIKKKTAETKRLDRYSIIPGEDIRAKLEAFVIDNSVTPAAVFYAAWGILLQKYCGSDDVVFGTTVPGRPAGFEGAEDMVGLFSNTIPLRIRSAPGIRIIDLLAGVTNILREREEFEITPPADIESYSAPGGAGSLFDTVVTVENDPLDNPLLPPDSLLSVHSYSIFRIPHYDFSVSIMLFKGIEIKFSYNRGLFNKDAVERLAGHFGVILDRVIENPGIQVKKIDVLTEEEKRRLIYDFNDTAADYPRDKTIHRLFREQVEQRPDRVALVCEAAGNIGRHGERRVLTYRELNNQAGRLAHLLMEKGLGPGTIVGIMVKRSIGMVTGILGILKAGGAYLPIDPGCPQKRIDYMLRDSAAKIVLGISVGAGGHHVGGGQALARDLSASDGQPQGLPLQAAPQSPVQVEGARAACPAPAAGLAYVIYTSGSTGRPKGVMVTHRSVVRLVKNTNYFDFPATGRLLMTGELVFDVTTFEIWGALANGMQLHIAPRETVLDGEKLERRIKQDRITILHLIPQLFNQLYRQCPGLFAPLSYFFIGGDMVNPVYLNRLHEQYPALNIRHMYGPTENTTFSTFFSYGGGYGKRVPIGRPISNSTVQIRSRANHLQPIGVIGEIWVGGDGVAAGYLNNPELTAEKFVAPRPPQKTFNNQTFCSNFFNPTCTGKRLADERQFSKTQFMAPLNPCPRGGPGRAAGGMTLYKTGDLGRWQSNGPPAGGPSKATSGGVIEFLGRIDYQVKIRGVRIELGEIENRLLTHERIKDAIVIAGEAGSEKYLCAYVVAEPGETGPVDRGVLRDYLSAGLPDYMVPSYFVQLEKIPLTPNGKVDRKVLPEPGLQTAANFIAPRNKTEETLVTAWSETLSLKKEKISIDGNFFEQGGHSLKAALLASKIHKALNVKVTLTELFKNPTIRTLAEFIKNLRTDRFLSLEVIEKKEYYPLSPAQKRLYILDRMNLGSTFYNIPQAVLIEGKLDVEAFTGALARLTRRHESLRTSFDMVNGEPIQKVNRKVEFKTRYFDAAMGEGKKTVDGIIENFVRPFDLKRDLLLRVGLIEAGKHRHILMMDMHHIIADAASMNLYIRELMTLYTGVELPALKHRYKDYAQWQNSAPQKKAVGKKEEYWLDLFADEVPVLNLPIDYPRPGVQRFEGAVLSFELPVEPTRALNRLAVETGSTLYMVLLAIYNVFLSKISGREDIVVGTPTAGRRHADLERIVGMFVNTLAMRNYPKHSETFFDFLMAVRKRTLKAFENQEYQLEDLVEKVLSHRDAGRNPLFDTFFGFQDMKLDLDEIPGCDNSRLKMKPYEIETGISKFDISLTCHQKGERMVCLFEYCTKIFKQETIRRFVSYFTRTVSSVLADGNKKIAQVEIITEAEKKQVLFDFNDTAAAFPEDKTLRQLFEEQANRTPEQEAVTFIRDLSPLDKKKKDGTPGGRFHMVNTGITYGQLHDKSGRLARVLKGRGVGPGSLVGISVHRSIEMVIGMLAIVKAGGAYLPIDPGYPADRIEYMLKDSQTGILVTGGDLPGRYEVSKAAFTGEIIDIFDENNYPEDRSPLAEDADPGNLTYVMYTSGSTGRPKGVTIRHRSVARLVKNNRFMDFPVASRLLATGSIAFDITTFEIWAPLLNGWRLYLTGGNTGVKGSGASILADAGKLRQVIAENRVSILHLVPQLFDQLAAESLDIFAPLRYLLVGGDLVKPWHINRLREKYPRLKILHMYGPTENTTFSTYLPVDRAYDNTIPIGKPVSNSFVYILGKGNEILPIGAVGELCVGGHGLSRGYLNNPELTAEKFVDEQKFFGGPGGDFSKKPPGRRRQILYKTGDLARWQSDGNIEFLGRIDHQVKIRGIRIELGETESLLQAHPDIKEVILLPGETGKGDKYLCAYIIPRQKMSGRELREYLSKRLPGYMIPAYFVFLEQMPLNPHGKVDRKALPEPGIEETAAYTGPGNEIEEKLVRVWADILEIKKELIGIDANFFELGGHSLKAAAVISRINKEFNVNIPLVEIFKAPYVRKLAEHIQGSGKEVFTISSPGNNLALLKQSPGKAGHLFFIHDGSGEVESCIELCNRLHSPLNCWGIRLNRVENDRPGEMSLTGMAAQYIEEIKSLQPAGPYFIAGWSLGGMIAYEMALQLEERDEEAVLPVLIDAPAPPGEQGAGPGVFTGESEIEWIMQHLPDDKIRHRIKDLSHINDAWPLILEHLEESDYNVEQIKGIIPPALTRVIPNFHRLGIKELVYYLNTDRILTHAGNSYRPAKKIRAALHYLKAGQSRAIYLKSWRKYCAGSLKTYEIEGDHFSILKQPGVHDVARILDFIYGK